MEAFIRISLFIHVAAGCMALLSGLGAILFRKNIKLHRPAGKLYYRCMVVIFVTALYISLYKHNYFLLFIAIFTFHSCFTAFRSLQLKKLHLGQKPLFRDWLAEILNITANSGLLLLSVLLFLKGNMQWAIICLFFAFIGLRVSASNLKRLRGRLQGKNYWLLTHIGNMIGSYIGAITAFTVNNNRWMGLPDVVAWLAPTVILVPFIFTEFARINKLQNKPSVA